TLAHEIGHALIDNAEHSNDNLAEGSLMNAATSQSFGVLNNGTFDTKRISDYAFNWLVVVRAANPGGVLMHGYNGVLPLWIAMQTRSMHAFVLTNNRLQFVNR
ncbi:MAG: hypothetical protein KDD47_08080, partial [Acidobacteria bacterium]|nr:hypothetical protein [Acidobacteriota bacterium]